VTHADACAYAIQGRIPRISYQQIAFTCVGGACVPFAFAFSLYPLLATTQGSQRRESIAWYQKVIIFSN
jgi:hypothetical protein